jgi:Nucleotide modification associated domain 1
MNTTKPDLLDTVNLIELGIKTQAGKEFLRLSLEDTLLFDKKQSDYGSHNISDFGMFGCVVRMNDKFRRIQNLFGKGRKARVNESIRDNLQDISNYSKIARLIDAGKWPDE